MSYIHTPTLLYPVSERDIRNLFPNTSFPTPFVPPDEYAFVFPSPQPDFDQVTQFAREVAPILTVKGHYEQGWEVGELFTDEADRQAALDAHAKSLVPQAVPMLSAELELFDAGLLDDVEALVVSLPRTAQIVWRRAQNVERAHPLIAVVQQAKELTDAYIDQLFIRAAKR